MPRMKIIDARSRMEITVGTKVAYGDGEWLNLISVDEAAKKAKVRVAYYDRSEDDTKAETPSALEIASKIVDRSGATPALKALEIVDLDVDLLEWEDWGDDEETVLVLPA